jgi:RNA polymerase sigma factor (sigma-70 family)
MPIQVVQTHRPKPTALTVAPAAELPKSESLGIDLAKRGHEVRKLLFAGFGARIARSGYDPEDVLQEVYRGILARNVGKCPFDVKKSSFGHYVHMVCECILNNYHRRETRRREVEQVGMPSPLSMRGDGCGTVDAAEVAEKMLVTNREHWSHPEGEDTMGEAVRRLGRHLDKKNDKGLTVDPLSMQVAALLADGLNRREIALKMGVSPNRVSQVITNLRERVADWL